MRSGLVIRSSSALSRAYISMDARYPLPSWPANTHPNRQLVIACTIALTRNTMTHVGGASRSSVSKFQAGAFAVNAAMLAAKTGAAVSAARSISPSTRERRKYTHSIRHRRPGRDGPIKYPRDRPIFEPSAPQAEHSPSDLAFRPFAQSQRADRADKACAPGHGKGCGALCLNCGTSLERIAPESLTPSLSEFVHGHIWWHSLCTPQNRVSGQKGGSPPMLKWINGETWR